MQFSAFRSYLQYRQKVRIVGESSLPNLPNQLAYPKSHLSPKRVSHKNLDHRSKLTHQLQTQKVPYI